MGYILYMQIKGLRLRCHKQLQIKLLRYHNGFQSIQFEPLFQLQDRLAKTFKVSPSFVGPTQIFVVHVCRSATGSWESVYESLIVKSTTPGKQSQQHQAQCVALCCYSIHG